MPIPLDIANLASSHVEDDIHLGTLDLANLNSSNDLQPDEEPILPSAAQVVYRCICYVTKLCVNEAKWMAYRLTKSTIMKTATV